MFQRGIKIIFDDGIPPVKIDGDVDPLAEPSHWRELYWLAMEA
jgi:hypothetical protein